MSVKIQGIDKLLREVEQKVGASAVDRIGDKALIRAANVFKEELIRQLSGFKDTGATVDEVTLTEPYLVNGVKTITVKWQGPKNRFRIIHLNEFGTVKNPNPKGKGAIARALANSRKAYREAIKKEIEGGL